MRLAAPRPREGLGGHAPGSSMLASRGATLTQPLARSNLAVESLKRTGLSAAIGDARNVWEEVGTRLWVIVPVAMIRPLR